MDEMTTVWLAYFDVDNNVVVDQYLAKLTAKRVRVTTKDYGTRVYDRDKLHTSREEALAALRKWTVRNLAFAQSKVEEAAEQLADLTAFENGVDPEWGGVSGRQR